MNLDCGQSGEYIGALTGERVSANGGRIQVKVRANSGEIWIPIGIGNETFELVQTVEIVKPQVPVKVLEEPKKPVPVKVQEEKAEKIVLDPNKQYEDMTVEELQEAILKKMRQNGPVSDYMLGTVRENKHHGSLVIWVKSFG